MKPAITQDQRLTWRAVGLSLSLLLPAARLSAQAQGSTPADAFDLSHWSLTLPDQDATVITPAELSAGFTNSYFYSGADGAMVFWCPVTGGTTSSSDFPRSELREMINPLSNQVNWSPYGTHVLNAQCRVTQLPSAKRVVIAQIHSYFGDAPPLVLLVFNDGYVEALVKLISTSANNITYRLAYVGLNNDIQYQLQMEDGVVSIAVNGVSQTVNVFATDAAWASQTYYFKAGNYCLDNAGLASEGAKVRFFQLSVQHRSSCKITNVAANNSQCCLTWTSRPGQTYYVQGRTAASQGGWVTLSPPLAAQSLSTSYCVPLPSPYCFFRVGTDGP